MKPKLTRYMTVSLTPLQEFASHFDGKMAKSIAKLVHGKVMKHWIDDPNAKVVFVDRDDVKGFVVLDIAPF